MNSLDRKALALVAILLVLPTLVGLIVALLVPGVTSGPFILTPRAGDKVGKTFTVAGTSGTTTPTKVNVVVSNTHDEERNGVSANPDYSESFTSANTGPETAVVTFSRSGPTPRAAVNFEIVADPDLIVDPSEVTPTVMEVARRKAKVKVKIQHKGGGTPTIDVTLFTEANALAHGPKRAVHKGGVNWEAEFTDVEEGFYSIEIIRMLDSKRTTTSRMENVLK